MAVPAHCIFCFETLAATLEKRKALPLAQVEDSWTEYQLSLRNEDVETEAGAETENDDEAPKPAGISRLLNYSVGSAGSSNSSLPSSGKSSTTASGRESGVATPASSKSSVSSIFSLGKGKKEKYIEVPLFITWNTVSARSGHKSLRGCIGTFEPMELESGLRSYALTSALEDPRFPPIPASLFPSLSAHVTLLTNFSSPSRDPLAWTLGLHGIRISFYERSRRLSSTYLPDVAPEQGWDKEEAVVSLMRKAGWRGREEDWRATWDKGKGELVTYEGKVVGVAYEEYKGWREWVEKRKGPPQELAKHTSRHSQLTAQRPSNSLLDLPAELRTEIYALVLYKPVPDRDWWQPNLAFTSRQLRNELLPLFYSLTHFRIDIGPGMTVDPRLKGALADTRQARQWALSLTNDDIKDMRKVSLHTDLRYGGDYLQPLMFELEITRSGKVVCGRVPDPDAADLVDDDDDDDRETEWDHVEIYNAELRRGIDALEMAL
ncbi:hypothetical protein B0A48_06891 [Cryoendolithus antarcticus]|uniref:AMMECR1 domain-containing protein n=1 Tax=Cryoendolithus antarcticus TaxID=1507870 RepID=A0A1V8T9L0_9PEZI|nr:hypothetical protein B0A48_06891 [Cryoendolithus antarcticus]